MITSHISNGFGFYLFCWFSIPIYNSKKVKWFRSALIISIVLRSMKMNVIFDFCKLDYIVEVQPIYSYPNKIYLIEQWFLTEF